jgi:hypothetical protein
MKPNEFKQTKLYNVGSKLKYVFYQLYKKFNLYET